MRNILVTGGAGFIGSNFIIYYLDHNPDSVIINLDALTYAGNTDNVKEIANHPRYRFIQGNICDRALIERLFYKYDIKDIIHLAAESHVDNSIARPDAFMQTNIMGTFNLLDVAKKYWMDSPGIYKEQYQNSRFHHVSTDEVFGDIVIGRTSENDPYKPSSPYAASKASSDHLVYSYIRLSLIHI